MEQESVKLETFKSMGLSMPVLKALEEMGFEEPSPIQVKTIPLILEGHDLIGQAQTGTGKTAAFGVPIVERLDHRSKKVQALVMAPTRELAIQVSEEITKIGRHSGVKVVPIYGGQSYDRQIKALEHGAQVVIGTPGRVMDHIRRGTLKLDSVRMVVLDEADEMLDMGFIEDVEFILQNIPTERQTMLFSATVPEAISRLARKYLKNPEHISISPERLTVPKIEQVYYEVREHEKLDGLSRILDMESAERTIIFCRTKKRVDELAEGLQARGYSAEAIHGDLNQVQRNRVLKRFKEGASEILVATDVAARGLDIDNVTHVINYDLPQDTETYVHRIGRTGRAGRSGTAITLVLPKEFRQFRQMERILRVRLQRRPLPTQEDVAEKQREALKNRLADEIERGVLPAYQDIVMELAQSYDSVDIAAAALRLMLDKGHDQPVEGEFGETGAEPGMVRLFLNLGRMDRVSPADIVRGLAEGAHISGSVIGLIDIYDRFTFVEMPKDAAAKVLQNMGSIVIRGKSVNMEPARPR
ncbi:DEAD/DEAH box helicase [Sulfobacillus thermosulfidooxidans]|uniref:ATP-dependent RNA helicase CshA n=2 Tax=Sulfobacillus thermosulfidooxidans TaxID=28034 RepID=A0A1W1WLJ5_SULTA|nr:DEAD/DEAH box helicase [Sulfobacillus thermosulfidooxidans]OLZ09559.1 RNA helicase [Sulfobacillus thermosulfidooxidans]OLZ16135.1 RNA helicase [Sulfobacillus thermosulfidooxidans]OLZ18017.1 RNA helicase [Sulfobacillus thermosulfidooxidans]PSR29759.1 MAG: ATP-dependent helicase [Sulfobacillus thermosulfidooxidans]SMC07126.1 ATP-dependent RNA helicase DeaD [Sulfobacillus thermosulfidooxidans DSM 9293]